MNRFSALIRIWTLSVVIFAVIVAFAFMRLDVPIALYLWDIERFRGPLNAAFGSAIILSVEASVILITVVIRLTSGRIPVLAETLAIACLVSMCSYVVNDHILKVIFGVPNPPDVMIHGARHGFNLWMGSGSSGFPSGHMVLAASFAGVFMRLHRATVWLFSALLLIATGLLLAGDWHFLSDIIAGGFLGVWAGILAGEGWAAHTGR